MIKIRYACLPEGLHATAVARGRHATIYFRPGLAPPQRRDALRRLRRNARLGHAPPLSVTGLVRALVADRLSAALRTVTAALRCHPIGALGLAGMLAALAVTYLAVMSSPTVEGLGLSGAGPAVQEPGAPARVQLPPGPPGRQVPGARPGSWAASGTQGAAARAAGSSRRRHWRRHAAPRRLRRPPWHRAGWPGR